MKILDALMLLMYIIHINIKLGDKMDDIMFENLLKQYKNGEAKIKHLSITEKQFDYFRVDCYVNGQYKRIIDKNGRFDNIIDTIHTESWSKHMAEKLGFKNIKPIFTFIHNPSLWDNDCGDAYDYEFDGHYRDGLDDIEELNYLP